MKVHSVERAESVLEELESAFSFERMKVKESSRVIGANSKFRYRNDRARGKSPAKHTM